MLVLNRWDARPLDCPFPASLKKSRSFQKEVVIYKNSVRQKLMEIFFSQRLNIGFSMGTMWLRRLLRRVVKGMVEKRWVEPSCYCASTVPVVPEFWTPGR